MRHGHTWRFNCYIEIKLQMIYLITEIILCSFFKEMDLLRLIYLNGGWQVACEKKLAGVLFLPLWGKKEPCRRLTQILNITFSFMPFPQLHHLTPFAKKFNIITLIHPLSTVELDKLKTEIAMSEQILLITIDLITIFSVHSH